MDTDGTETQTDIKLETEDTETPKDELTHTQAQVDEEKRQARNAALADVGRLQKEAENAVKATNAAQERIKRMLKEQEDEELKAAEGDQERISALKERQKRRQVESELDDTTLKLNQKDDELTQLKASGAEATKAQVARDIATRLGVDADRLSRLSKFTDGSVESMEELAKELPKKEVRPQTKTDSGVNAGGGRTFTREAITAMPIEEYEKNRPEIEKARMAGKIK